MQTVYSAAIPVNGIQLPGNLHDLLTECFIDVTVIFVFHFLAECGCKGKGLC